MPDSVTACLALQGQHRQHSEAGQGAGSCDKASSQACGHGERGAQPQVRFGLVPRCRRVLLRLVLLRLANTYRRVIATVITSSSLGALRGPGIAMPGKIVHRHQEPSPAIRLASKCLCSACPRDDLHRDVCGGRSLVSMVLGPSAGNPS